MGERFRVWGSGVFLLRNFLCFMVVFIVWNGDFFVIEFFLLG